MALTRNQEYKYQYKTISIANTFFCGNGPTLNVAIPDNLLDLKAVFLHAVLQFDASTDSSKRKIYYAGGKYPKTADGIPKPTEGNLIYTNKSADPITRIADLRLDITSLKEGLMLQNILSLDQPTMEINLITDIDGNFDSSGSVILWKIDFVYTTQGIQ